MSAQAELTLSPEKAGSPGPQASPPLVVDLDGTLVRTDLLVESFFGLLKQNPLYLFLVPYWLLKGRARLKQQIALRAPLDATLLPYNARLLDYLRARHGEGRRLVLATGCDERTARQVADHLGIFDRVLASDGTVNLAGRHKQERLIAEFGEKSFDYAGDEKRDLTVWASARRAILVSPSRALQDSVASVSEIEGVFPNRTAWLKPYLRALRPHHWLKNLLVFAPLAMAHRYRETDLLAEASVAFLAFGLCASSVYLINDMADLPCDRRHPRKRLRPFAAGDLSLFWGLGSIPVLLGLSILVSLLVPWPLTWMVAIYFLLNLGYSFSFKKVAILDVIVLSGLYTMRIMAGSAAVDIWPSAWLLAFSTFLFMSLALVKRYAELVTMSEVSGDTSEVRGYRIMDKELLSAMGSGSGYVAVLVLAIYISSGAAEIHYARHQLIWFLCPLLLYWISYVWLIAHRGGMHDDPLVFALRGWISRIVFSLAAVTLLLAE